MKNDFCGLSREEIVTLPERFQGFFLSPFQFNQRNGYVGVPDDTFKEMIDLLVESAQVAAAANPKSIALEIEGRRARGLMLCEAEKAFLKAHLHGDEPT